jgi:hypothetical protein
MTHLFHHAQELHQMIHRLQALPFQKHHAFDQSSQVIIFVSGNTCSIENRSLLNVYCKPVDCCLYISTKKARQDAGYNSTDLIDNDDSHVPIEKSSMKMSRCHHYLHWSVLIISMHLSSIVQICVTNPQPTLEN